MNHLGKYFLPSQVRGVYRFDDTFSEIDGASYDQFVENKLRFLPCSLIEPIRRSVILTEDFDSVSKKFSLDETPRDHHSRRAKTFFNNHPYFHNALTGNDAVNGAKNFLEIQFVKKILAPLLNDDGLAAIQPQKQVGPYYVDFAIDGPVRLAFEIDGFGKFKHRQDLDNFTVRQNYISQDWKIFRFTFGHVMHSTAATMRVLHDVLTANQYGNFLYSKPADPIQQQFNLFDIFRRPAQTGPDIFDLVNGFYQVQDWLVQKNIENSPPEIALLDDMGFPLPLVGLALSALYHFLDAVAAVVDVEFDLPAIKICCPSNANKWREHFHSAITVTTGHLPGEEVVTLDVIRNVAASLPTPLGSEKSITFRSGLTCEEIHQRLDYITSEVYGFRDGTNRFQDKVLQRIFDGQETLGIATTGSGKSFCFSAAGFAHARIDHCRCALTFSDARPAFDLAELRHLFGGVHQLRC